MNTANKLTLLRVALIPVFLIILYLDFPGANWAALAVFLLASVTDSLDGYVARHYNQVTNFGKFMDPLADKVLVMAAMCWFVGQGRMWAWALAAVLLREFAVSGLRLVAVERGRVIAAAWSGKIKTACTMVCLCVMLVFDTGWLNVLCWALILAVTVWSGAEYLIRNRDVFRDGK